MGPMPVLKKPAKFQIPKDIWVIDFCYSSTEINLGMCLAQARIAREVANDRQDVQS